MKKEINVGDSVYLKKGGDISAFRVTKLGRKYFYVKYDYKEIPVTFDTFRYEDKDYPQYNKQFYRTEEELLEILEMEKINERLYFQFSNNHSTKVLLTNEQLRRINQILDEGNK